MHWERLAACPHAFESATLGAALHFPVGTRLLSRAAAALGSLLLNRAALLCTHLLDVVVAPVRACVHRGGCCDSHLSVIATVVLAHACARSSELCGARLRSLYVVVSVLACARLLSRCHTRFSITKAYTSSCAAVQLRAVRRPHPWLPGEFAQSCRSALVRLTHFAFMPPRAGGAQRHRCRPPGPGRHLLQLLRGGWAPCCPALACWLTLTHSLCRPVQVGLDKMSIDSEYDYRYT